MNVCMYSGGKDSTATVILAHEHNEPLDAVLFCEVMFDENTSGELPEHIDFIDNVAFPKFREWGYDCIKVRAKKTYMDCFNHIITRSKHENRNGLYQGFPLAGMCKINAHCKILPLQKWERENHVDIQYVGIAPEETPRIKRAHEKGQISLMEKYGVSEAEAFKLCEQYGLLSPSYSFSKRGGCWFCPNAKAGELRHLRDNHPELWNELLLLEERENLCGYIHNMLTKKSIHDWDEEFRLEENQIKLF